MTKKYWFGHSLVWIGVLGNSPEAIAQTVSPPTPESMSQATPISFAPVPSAPVSLATEPAIAAISPPEAPSSIERSQTASTLVDSEIRSIEPTATPGVEACPDCGSPDVPTPNALTPNALTPDVLTPDVLTPNALTPDVPTAIDPVLEALPVAEPVADLLTESELTVAPFQVSQSADSTASGDPELGRLRLRESELAIEQEDTDTDTVFLRGRFDFFSSDNILLDDVDPISDQFGRAGLAIVALPQLGENTQLLASIGGNYAFYGDLSELNYSSLELRAEVRQTIFPNTDATIGWSNRQLFSSEDGDRFLNDHAVRFGLARRDALADRLTLDSYYQLRLNFADPSDRSRLTNTIGASLSYALQPDLDLGLNYELDLVDFTQQDRNDSYHQVTAQLTYDLTRNSRVSLYGGFSFGRSSESDVDFDSSIVGVSFSTFLPLF